MNLILFFVIYISLGHTKTCELPNPTDKEELSYSDLVSLIKAEKITNIDDLVPKLKAHKEFWTACGESESAQEKLADPTHPRIIAYGKSANMFLGYVSCELEDSVEKDYPDCEALEVIHRDPKTGIVEMREIRLPGKNSKKIEAKVSEPNPRQCLHCHGTPPLPVFESYNTWPGCFGSLSRDKNDVMLKNSTEEKNYKTWKDSLKQKTAPLRYTSLYWSDRANVITLPPSDKNNYTRQELVTATHGKDFAPNAKLTGHVNAMSQASMFQFIQNHPDYEYFKYTLAGIIFCGKNYLSEPASHFEKHNESQEAKEELQKYKEKFLRELELVKKQTLQNNPIRHGPYSPFGYINEGYLPGTGESTATSADLKMYYNIQNMFTIFKGGPTRLGVSHRQKYNGIDGSNLHTFSNDNFREYFFICDPELGKLLPKNNQASDSACEALGAKSKEYFAKWQEKNKPAKAKTHAEESK